MHDWVTGFGIYPLATEEENCELVEVTDYEVEESVRYAIIASINCVKFLKFNPLYRSVPKLDTLILVKSMIKNHSFVNPFSSIKSRFRSNGRSNSAPEVHFIDSDR